KPAPEPRRPQRAQRAQAERDEPEEGRPQHGLPEERQPRAQRPGLADRLVGEPERPVLPPEKVREKTRPGRRIAPGHGGGPHARQRQIQVGQKAGGRAAGQHGGRPQTLRAPYGQISGAKAKAPAASNPAARSPLRSTTARKSSAAAPASQSAESRFTRHATLPRGTNVASLASSVWSG